MDDRHDRVRQRAHALWEREGRPHGRHDQHWQMASSEFDKEQAPSNPSARSLGSAAQSDLIPDDAGQGSRRVGSLVDTGPALGLVAGGIGGAVGGLGGLSLAEGGDDDVAGGMSSAGGAEAGARKG